jgi:hypothetical protein
MTEKKGRGTDTQPKKERIDREYTKRDRERGGGGKEHKPEKKSEEEPRGEHRKNQGKENKGVSAERI